MLEGAGDVGELAWAHAALIRMQALAFDPGAALAAGPRALSLAHAAGSKGARVDVLVSLGAARGHRGEPEAHDLLAEALAEGVVGGLHFQCIRAYVNAASAAVDARQHSRLEALVEPARALFDDYQSRPARDAFAVDVAWSLLDRGRYEEAVATAASVRGGRLGYRQLRLALEGTVAARRGEPEASELLDSALAELAGIPEGRRHALVRAALAEAAWLRGDHVGGRAQAGVARAGPYADQFARPAGDLALWAWRCGDPVEPPLRAPEPVLRELDGDWRGAIHGWRELEAPYEAALAALAGDERAAREAVATLQQLGAKAAARAFARERAARGVPGPRGPRRSTLADPAGLTRREREVLTHVASGETNAGIASALHLSERTVAHHVSAVLRKLGAPTRTAAVAEAQRRGLLAQDGPAPGAT